MPPDCVELPPTSESTSDPWPRPTVPNAPTSPTCADVLSPPRHRTCVTTPPLAPKRPAPRRVACHSLARARAVHRSGWRQFPGPLRAAYCWATRVPRRFAEQPARRRRQRKAPHVRKLRRKLCHSRHRASMTSASSVTSIPFSGSTHENPPSAPSSSPAPRSSSGRTESASPDAKHQKASPQEVLSRRQAIVRWSASTAPTPSSP